MEKIHYDENGEPLYKSGCGEVYGKWYLKAGDLPPRGMANFTSWFPYLKGNGGNYNVMPSDADMLITNYNNNGILLAEIKPEGQYTGKTLPFGQKASLIVVGKANESSYGVLIQDPWWEVRGTDVLLHRQRLIKVSVFHAATITDYLVTLDDFHRAIGSWFETGVLRLENTP